VRCWAIGGLKEEASGSARGGIKTVLIPEENIKDLVEIPDNIKNKLEIYPVNGLIRYWKKALERIRKPLPENPDKLSVVGLAAEVKQPDVVFVTKH